MNPIHYRINHVEARPAKNSATGEVWHTSQEGYEIRAMASTSNAAGGEDWDSWREAFYLTRAEAEGDPRIVRQRQE